MKNRIIIAIAILLSMPASVLAQTALETAVLNELNSFRKANKLQPVVYSAEVTKAAKHHTQWMAATNTCSHYETSEVPGIKKLYSPEDRGNFYGLLKNINSSEEICNWTKSTEGFAGSKKNDTELAKDVISNFAASTKGHRESLLSPVSPGDTISVGISVSIKGEVAYTTIYFIEK